MEDFEKFDAIVKIRSGGLFSPRPNVLAWNGKKVKVTVLYQLENRKPYSEGEFACQIEGEQGERFPFGWIASGDLNRLN